MLLDKSSIRLPGACDVTDVVKSVGILKEAGKLIDHRLVKRVWMPIPASASISSGVPATRRRPRTCLSRGSLQVLIVLHTRAAFCHEKEGRA